MERKEVIISDLAARCEPQANISPVRRLSCWNSVPYELKDIRGSLLCAVKESRPQDIFLAPQLTGWYRIYVGQHKSSERISLKLSSDRAFTWFRPDASAPACPSDFMEEVYWKAADLTDEKIVIHKNPAPDAEPYSAILSWFRFVPMSEAEVAAFQAQQARQDTKRLYATHDMHGQLCCGDGHTLQDWEDILQCYEQSDVEWFSMENLFLFDGDTTTGDVESFAFSRPCDRQVQKYLSADYTEDTLRHLIARGHEMGLKMCGSTRMGAWGIEFPLDQAYFTSRFMEANNEKCRCIDRDGTPIDALSYIYPEVRRFMIDQILRMARLGFDAVEMIWSRGVPYVLFEQPFVELFIERYGEDPRPLALDEPRVTQLRCEVLTGFVEELRAALDEALPDKKTGLHARCNFSLYDSRHIAVDVEEWAKRGLITAIISYPQRIREVLEGGLWQDEERLHLDMERYSEFACGERSPIVHSGDVDFIAPWPDSRGVPQGPVSQRQRIEEFMAIEKKYGVTVYIDVMPRWMSTEEYRRRALELYELGAEHLSFWDTYGRAPFRWQWNMLRRLGHKDELAALDGALPQENRVLRTLHIGDKDISRYWPRMGG